jgi:cytochrome c oxidase assembly protein subunit 15
MAVVTTALTYVLIAVGGLVRASGAGLGCPDWPRCFGSWIPPASAAELPAQFDPALFNPARMWTEYLNRVLGVSVGFAILATTISAWRTHRRELRIVWAIVSALLLTGFQGWLGGRVVVHELAPWIVTTHMLVALVIVSLLLWATVESLAASRVSSRGGQGSSSRHEGTPHDLRRLGWCAWGATALLLVQVAIGTQVRGRVDDALALVSRDQALATVGLLDMTHRNVSVLVGLAVLGLWVSAWLRHADHVPLVRAATVALACVVSQIAVGIALASFALPPPAQVAHLTVASLLLGALTTLALIAWRWPSSA